MEGEMMHQFVFDVFIVAMVVWPGSSSSTLRILARGYCKIVNPNLELVFFLTPLYRTLESQGSTPEQQKKSTKYVTRRTTAESLHSVTWYVVYLIQ